MGNLCSSSFGHPNRIGALGPFPATAPTFMKATVRHSTVSVQPCLWIGTTWQSQSSQNTVSVQSCISVCETRHSLGPVRTCLSPVLYVCATRHSLSPVVYMCVRDATRHTFSPVLYVCERHDTVSVSPVYVRARRDTVSFQSAHSLSPVLYMCELTFNFPSSKESRLTEQAISRLVTIYKPHEHMTTHTLFIYSLYTCVCVCVCVCVCARARARVNITKYPLNMKKRVVSERASTPIQSYWYYYFRQHIDHSRRECRRGSE